MLTLTKTKSFYRLLVGKRVLSRVVHVLACLGVCFIVVVLLTAEGYAVVIGDKAGGTIYWGGKYVNIKPTAYEDVIGRRTAVDQMEVTMNDDIMTVIITGPYFFNYVHKMKRTQDAPPGDLYISSQGWKVSGAPPYVLDIFEPSEGWDYVVSMKHKKVYTLDFSKITMTSALPHERRYRSHQAWRGGYGEAVDDAAVTLTDTGLTFVFSVRNMRLGSEIGLHWTMKCGNDIVEGSALIPPIATAFTSDAAPAQGLSGDPLDALAIEPEAAEPPMIPVAPASAPLSDAFPSATVGGSGLWTGGSFAGAAGLASIRFGSQHGSNSVIPATGPVSGQGNYPAGPTAPAPGDNPDAPVVPVEPPSGPDSPAAVPEPVTALLLLASLAANVVRRLLTEDTSN